MSTSTNKTLIGGLRDWATGRNHSRRNPNEREVQA
jgi:hypothetical protein